MNHHLSWVGALVFFLLLVPTGCLKDLQRVPSDLSQAREGYFRDGTFYNDVYGFRWSAPGWTPVTPGLTLGQRFLFGWNSPADTVKARLWLYDRSISAQGRGTVPADACLREAAASIALRLTWAFLESEEVSFNGRTGLRATYLQGADEKGVAFFWMEHDAVFAVNAFASDAAFEQHLAMILDVLGRMVFFEDIEGEEAELLETAIGPAGDQAIEYVSHTIRYSGETLAVIAQWYTGSAVNWNRIMEHNPDVSPTALRLGQVIQIPLELVVKDDPMPESFLRQTRPRPAPPSPEAPDEAQTQAQENDATEDESMDFIIAPPR